ncbi:hypothetical protein HN51_058846 [Arachis hypogaea]
MPRLGVPHAQNDYSQDLKEDWRETRLEVGVPHAQSGDSQGLEKIGRSTRHHSASLPYPQSPLPTAQANPVTADLVFSLHGPLPVSQHAATQDALPISTHHAAASSSRSGLLSPQCLTPVTDVAPRLTDDGDDLWCCLVSR